MSAIERVSVLKFGADVKQYVPSDTVPTPMSYLCDRRFLFLAISDEDRIGEKRCDSGKIWK